MDLVKEATELGAPIGIEPMITLPFQRGFPLNEQPKSSDASLGHNVRECQLVSWMQTQINCRGQSGMTTTQERLWKPVGCSSLKITPSLPNSFVVGISSSRVVATDCSLRITASALPASQVQVQLPLYPTILVRDNEKPWKSIAKSTWTTRSEQG